ncbi:conserved hypothetical protein (plasmid) [Rhizobium leguminosarum bv. trifolii WSM2304]|uniref:DUF2934 domain-containing protein n=1 Tax=Rhizobium leguminosarum bv. trifolii (strain WSM2304) TaxID=395492 RepID=A0ABF7QWC8_RHILW|nr:DUF2934 domain-containing protein [Rhizobium leguminosarum]ACI58446.1 conserved hypothetical protein [Rhizobium leguminosarum bv. trifolii WSM2304]
MDDEIRKAAYKRWEDEGHPEGQHERHWREAEEEVRSKSTGVPQTWSSDHGGGVNPPSEGSALSEPSSANEPGSLKPGELASENK